MKKQTDVAIEARISRGAFYLLLLTAGTMMAFLAPQTPTKIVPRTLSFAERVAYQRAIEEVYWRHRIWPKENPDPKPSFDAVMSQAQLEKKVEDYLLNSQAVEDYYKQPLSAEQLQGEMDRMARDTRQPEVLRELFEALGNDPIVIAECLARPVLSERMTTGLHVTQTKTGLSRPNVVAAATANYILPKVADGGNGCTNDTWTPTSTTNAPDRRQSHTAVWTGTEMIIWGGTDASNDFNTGGRYTPSTDSWTSTSTVNVPERRAFHAAVWTGAEMIVWGGEQCCPLIYFNTGGRYNPSTDSWVATTTTGAPDGRSLHTAVWTGSEMIVWGGHTSQPRGDGSRYNPNTDSWTKTRPTNVHPARYSHTAVWTGSEMIVWGGTDGSGVTEFNTGGRYNPISNAWRATTTTGAPAARSSHTAIWSGAYMIIWGGANSGGDLNTGGRYDPNTDSWTATATSHAPSARDSHKAVWTGSEMIVWGGFGMNNLRTGGRYNPTADSWVATTTTEAPVGRVGFTAVWSGNEMIVWGGFIANVSGIPILNTGGRYCAESGPIPTATPTPGLITR
jgi:N-acetylneuraminic acid mutarotase